MGKNKRMGTNKLQASATVWGVIFVPFFSALAILLKNTNFHLFSNDVELRYRPDKLCDCHSSTKQLCDSINETSDTLPLNVIVHPLDHTRETSKNVNIGIFMIFSGEISSYALHSATMNGAYAASHNYDFMLMRTVLVKKDRQHQFSHAVSLLDREYCLIHGYLEFTFCILFL
jgi:hypothetical protein